jgi:MFS-type transporter involved in bile tolerance (Atg22 family)
MGLTFADWVVLGIWWFIFQQKRPGPKVPKGSTYTTIGFKQIWLAIREIRSLPQTFLYFFAYFLLADGLNTNGKLSSLLCRVSARLKTICEQTDTTRYTCFHYSK